MSSTIDLHILEPGWLSTFQDLGRENTESLGVPTAGAADQHSAAVANILVGNARNAVCFEILGGRFSFTPSADILIAVTGTPAEVSVNGVAAPQWEPVCVPAGARVLIWKATGGLRSYLAIAGELEAERFLGSAAPDARMGFPQQVSARQHISLRSGYTGFVHPYFAQPLFRLPVPVPDFSAQVWTVDVVDGPETGVTEGIRELMCSSVYTVGERSNQVGLRLSGPVLHPRGLGEIVSHGVPIGAVEIPHSDELIILGRSRTLTAGYPIVAVASAASLSMLGQAGPGRRLTFRWLDMDESVRLHREDERTRTILEDAVRTAFTSLGLPVHALQPPARRAVPHPEPQAALHG